MTRRWLWAPAAGVTVALLLPIATFLVAALLVGWRLQVVETGSMEPLFPVGSLVVVRPINPSDIRVGTPIAFDPEDGRQLVTHRVVQVLESSSGLAFRTQGDANANPDPQPVPARAVRGRATWAVPQLGRLVRWLAWPRGFVLLVIVPAIVLLLTEVQARRRVSAPVAADATG